jgi:hypothetical protein
VPPSFRKITSINSPEGADSCLKTFLSSRNGLVFFRYGQSVCQIYEFRWRVLVARNQLDSSDKHHGSMDWGLIFICGITCVFQVQPNLSSPSMQASSNLDRKPRVASPLSVTKHRSDPSFRNPYSDPRESSCDMVHGLRTNRTVSR